MKDPIKAPILAPIFFSKYPPSNIENGMPPEEDKVSKILKEVQTHEALKPDHGSIGLVWIYLPSKIRYQVR